MVTRRELKDAHEQAVVTGFIAYSNECGYNMTLIDRPDPPDAVIDVDGQRTWLEITDAWMDREYARHHTTWASDDAAHVPTAPCRFGDIDENFQQILSEVIKSKYENIQLQNHAKQHGQGTLLVGVFTPFALAKELAQTEKPTISQLVEGQPIKPFDNIFLYDGIGERSFYLIYREG